MVNLDQIYYLAISNVGNLVKSLDWLVLLNPYYNSCGLDIFESKAI